jgi:hypothetical protein
VSAIAISADISIQGAATKERAPAPSRTDLLLHGPIV